MALNIKIFIAWQMTYDFWNKKATFKSILNEHTFKSAIEISMYLVM